MSISILQVCCSGGYYLPLCGVCSLFLSGDFPYLKGEEDHALELVYCLEELESFWGELIFVDQNPGAFSIDSFSRVCGLCGDEKPIVHAIVDFKKECEQ